MQFAARLAVHFLLAVLIAAGGLLCAPLRAAAEPDAAPTPQLDFQRDIRPIVDAKCLRCHNATKNDGRLDMSTRATMLKGGVSGPAFVPGDSRRSLMIELVEFGEMPPQKEDPRVAAAELEKFRAWVDAGAPETPPPGENSPFSQRGVGGGSSRAAAALPESADQPPLVTDLEARHLANVRQVTFGLPRAGEGYFSHDGEWIVYQAYPIGYPFYQIYVQKLDERTPQRISTGRGRTTCAYFSRDGEKILFASSHTDPEIDRTERQARAEEAREGRRGYEWVFDPHMELYVCNRDGTELTRLTESPGYDAEGSFSPDGRWIVFTSTRAGAPNLYVMRADGSGLRQLTDNDSYDGGPFFSPDGQWIIFRSDRQKKDMLQLHAISVDGQHEVQLTDDLNTINWAPYFHPSGRYIIWSRADYSRGPQAANFDLFTMEIEHDATTFRGGEVERITSHPKADVLPVFSPDGKKLMWTSTRTADGTSQLWIGDWKRETR